jgi:acetone carboxylase gamma subunit
VSEQRLTEYLVRVGPEIRCRRCSHVLGPAHRSFKLGSLVRELPLTEANPHLRDPSIYTDHSVVFRQFICPGCGTMLDTEVAVAGAPAQWDIRVA